MGVVLFAFGVTQTPAGASLPGPLLMRLLADLGLSGSAARAVLLRMRRDGILYSTRDGRVAHYALAPAIGAVEERLEAQLRGKRPTWNGAFHGLLYEVPETHRPFRDRLRRLARLSGYAPLRSGLLIAPTDRTVELAAVLYDTPPQAEVLTLWVELSLPDARRIAGRIWDLETLAQRYRKVLARTTNAIDGLTGAPGTGRDALGALFEALRPVYAVIGDDPDLPSELLPADWPGDQLGQVIGAVLAVLGPAVGAYLDPLREELGVTRHRPTDAPTSSPEPRS
jgi:phenylacetic acid degradation operon negative regulatory protein